MKKYLVASALACAAISSSAFAADGVINFTGKIVDNACIVDPTLNVQMGMWRRRHLKMSVMRLKSSPDCSH